MYKSAAHALAFTHRIASESTKARPSGRVDTLPPNAKEKEVLYESFKEQFRNIKRNIARIDDEMPTADDSRAADLRAQRTRQLEALGQVATFARRIGEEAYCTVFYYLAVQRLPKELFGELDIETRMIMGRQRHEIQNPNKRTRSASLARLPRRDN